MLEKIATFHWNLKFSLNSVGKKHKISKKSRLGETQAKPSKGFQNTFIVFTFSVKSKPCVSPKRDFFEILCFFPTETDENMRFQLKVAIFSKVKTFLFFTLKPNYLRFFAENEWNFRFLYQNSQNKILPMSAWYCVLVHCEAGRVVNSPQTRE